MYRFGIFATLAIFIWGILYYVNLQYPHFFYGIITSNPSITLQKGGTTTNDPFDLPPSLVADSLKGQYIDSFGDTIILQNNGKVSYQVDSGDIIYGWWGVSTNGGLVFSLTDASNITTVRNFTVDSESHGIIDITTGERIVYFKQ